MENKEQDFINRYKNVQESIVKAMDKALERAIGNKAIDFEKCEGNYLDAGIIELAVIEDDGSGCDGCIFNDRNYYCKNTCCINVDRKDSTDIIYKEVKRS